MAMLILGLIIFLGVHSVRIFASDWRSAQMVRLGKGKWKALYALLSLIGLLLIVYGYAMARQDPVWLWFPPVWARHMALVLTIPAFILLAAAYVPGNAIRSRLGHPMLAGVKVWALSHLLANGTLADVLLFGSFLAWSIAGFAVFRRRDRAAGLVAEAGSWKGSLIAVGVGLLVWYLFAVYLHILLFGVSPLP